MTLASRIASAALPDKEGSRAFDQHPMQQAARQQARTSEQCSGNCYSLLLAPDNVSGPRCNILPRSAANRASNGAPCMICAYSLPVDSAVTVSSCPLDSSNVESSFCATSVKFVATATIASATWHCDETAESSARHNSSDAA